MKLNPFRITWGSHEAHPVLSADGWPRAPGDSLGSYLAGVGICDHDYYFKINEDAVSQLLQQTLRLCRDRIAAVLAPPM
jgi:hypothetical protein